MVLETQTLHQPWTVQWEEAICQKYRNAQLRQGYPKTRVQVVAERQIRKGNTVLVDAVVQIFRGPRIRLGQIRFRGVKHTRPSLLQARARLQGPWLDRTQVDRARERLSRLGVFRSIQVIYEQRGSNVQDVVFHLQEVPTTQIDLLAGFSSFDLLFGGVEIQKNNLFGLAHSMDLRLIQSFRSSVGHWTYTVPDVFWPNLTAFASVQGLYRRELSFDREELQMGVGVRQAFPKQHQEIRLRYSQELLSVNPSTQEVMERSAWAAAWHLEWAYDARDHPLSPRHGWKVFAGVEWAEPSFGGESSYQRLEFGAGWHTGIHAGLFLHCNLWHGLVANWTDPSKPIPMNKRFFPGGDSTIRGYQRGQASPLDRRGKQIGAESVVVGNVELERLLTRNWSVVLFTDVAGISPSLDHYPVEFVLVSVGAGIRWNTPIGPVRLEYGHNLNPRRHDPSGTVHLSIGAPF